MTDVSLAVVFNHRHSASMSAVMQYNSRFSNNLHVIAPFELDGVIQYSNGSYLWQGAIVEYFKKLDKREGYTLFIHDDLVLNPATVLSDLVGMDSDCLHFHKTQKLEGWLCNAWIWFFRILSNWFTSKHQSFGSGAEDVVTILKESLLYKKNHAYIDSLETSKWRVPIRHAHFHEIMSSWLTHYFPEREEFDFGLPLFAGNSDYCLFPNSHAPLIEDFLRRTIECGLFVEVAIPTLVEWMGIAVHYSDKHQIFADGEARKMLNRISSVEDIEDYFRENPEITAIHPVKFSRFMSEAK